MTALTAALDTALKADSFTFFVAVKIETSVRDICLLDGAGELSFGGDSYAGEDSIFGSMSSDEELEDGIGDEAPGGTLTLTPAGSAVTADFAALTAPGEQGSPVTIWLGAIDQVTGAVIADPYLWARLETDVVTLIADEDGRTLDIDLISPIERWFETDQGARLTPSHHKAIWPGETGLDNVHGVARKDAWGTANETSAAVSGGFGGGGSGKPGGWLGGPRLVHF